MAVLRQRRQKMPEMRGETGSASLEAGVLFAEFGKELPALDRICPTPTIMFRSKTTDMNTMSATSRDQMELSLDRQSPQKPVVIRQRRFNRARWWFAQMHRVVDEALDVRSKPQARPEQADLSFSTGSRFAGFSHS